MNKAFCNNCNQYVNYTIKKSFIKEYKGTTLNVEENIPVCEVCGEELFIPEIENENLKRLYDEYRKLSGIISPEQIISFRRKYGISQRELVAILGWGKMTINRYERGSLPNQSHSDVLKTIISHTEAFNQKVQESYELKRISDKLYKKLQESFNTSKKNLSKSLIEFYLSHPESILNGFRKFDIDRVENLISYIADRVDNLYKTSVNKYLWFIDFENFKENVRSITGLRYAKFQFGPVVEEKRYEEIINLLDEKFYKEEIEDYNSCSVKTKIISRKNYDMSLFTDEEISVIDKVINKLKDMTCSEISDKSHKESGWLNNSINELISYEYAEYLKIKF